MEKSYRLYLKNLPYEVNENEVKSLFEDYGTVVNVDIKEKKDVEENCESKFAFVVILATDKNLNACFKHVNTVTLNGRSLSVVIAKESFLERLKRERQEAAVSKSKETSNTLNSVPLEIAPIKLKINPVKTPTSIKIQNDHVSSSFKKRKNNEEEVKDICIDPMNQDWEDDMNWKEKHSKIDIKSPEKNNVNHVFIDVPKKEMTISEKKRIQSLKEKKLIFKAKEQMIRDALKSVDKAQNKKIVFEDDVGQEDDAKKNGKDRKLLFDDAEDVEANWDENQFEIKNKTKEKLSMLQAKLGHDKRFTLDERFIDDDEVTHESELQEKVESSLEDEKKWQLDILQNVLGKPIKSRTESNAPTNLKRKGQMIRYDPTENNHYKYEVPIETSVPKKSEKKKRKISVTENEEPAVPVSKDVFYNVSDRLADSLKQDNEFSLLKTFAREPTNTVNEPEAESYSKSNFQFDFNKMNPFKYDSSDNEDHGDDNQETSTGDNEKINSKISHGWNDRFFFAIDDVRFHDTDKFFNKEAAPRKEFENLRRELKQIVRTKIRNNTKKTTSWTKRKTKK
ncbi:probable RNA-binding protein CG14230 [Cephus cinctus]|uniref:Probable RNA-binding protein CG14230 n=1 Tax=Cephus cinctus TaxID=211228 RepID=A0AAJ7RH81_CEPCN|nr:probable RNA-binding protein CG14230 [Cephus cinctus]XP_024940823.1 probable RNA-binding protein CG14230 [Cephus cinctus]